MYNFPFPTPDIIYLLIYAHLIKYSISQYPWHLNIMDA